MNWCPCWRIERKLILAFNHAACWHYDEETCAWHRCDPSHVYITCIHHMYHNVFIVLWYVILRLQWMIFFPLLLSCHHGHVPVICDFHSSGYTCWSIKSLFRFWTFFLVLLTWKLQYSHHLSPEYFLNCIRSVSRRQTYVLDSNIIVLVLLEVKYNIRILLITL